MNEVLGLMLVILYILFICIFAFLTIFLSIMDIKLIENYDFEEEI